MDQTDVLAVTRFCDEFGREGGRRGKRAIRVLTVVSGHGSISEGRFDMEEIAISKFKATCASVLDRVRKTGKAVRVTRFGKPVAEVVPHRASRKPERWVGSLAGTGQITGDIVSPASEEDDWEVLRG
jgi:prevent-host-death family protein